MKKKNKKTPKVIELEMLDDCLTRLHVIGKRQALPTQHFFREAEEIVKDALLVAYRNGVTDGKQNETTFPVEYYESKK